MGESAFVAEKGIDTLVLVALLPEGAREESLDARLKSPSKMTSISLCKC